MSDISGKDVTRRGFFRKMGTGAVACVAVSGVMGGVAGNAQASDINALISEKMGAGAIEEGKVQLKMKDKADNGALVRVPVKVDHPQEAGNYIESIGIFVDNNPRPAVAQFNLTPHSGKAEMEVRIKMAKSSAIRVIARTNSGKLYGATKNIEVAAGGCVG
ncbi:MAG: thiosulfate oxidation carrier protein SoxY [Magnetococcales bacterium]|nr:thiosulfate oxidation carrier protein SoxY [Magnetococcales bacterium]